MKNIIEKNEEIEFLENNLSEISLFIGKKEDYYLNIFKGLKNKINYCALFFGPFWMGYRKMYYEAFILGGLITVVKNLVMLFELLISSNILSNIIMKSLNCILPLLMGLFGNYLYFLSIKRRIINKNERTGVSKVGILYGSFLVILMPLFFSRIIGYIILKV